ncbi:YhgE/Pip family protein [Subtercola sp. PAMC28395]|uniref:YhgE/Pip family protein n=1 Tax=Subtercola sp. PAMC28395 TaxID=2846775 RepID=UPI001C0CCD4B|nr:YhgE/Pip family protein [Subtercola sp. PAMC28395]QWT24816.1 YhgE/Pip family protein [Subtercola sp. PAMC28395]
MTSHSSPTGTPKAPAVGSHESPARQYRRRRAWWFAIAALAVIAIPLAANGLFSSAFSNVADNLSKVPAAVVNNDKLITTTAADGTQSTVYAGRGLVTELTGPSSTGFDWNVTNSADAAKGLADGTYFAVLTIPENFSQQISTQGTPNPVQGSIDIATDNSHGYLAGVVASTVASAIKAGFGQTITTQVMSGVLSSFGTIGTQLTTAADGAGKVASGQSSLTDGLNQLASGASSSATGAATLSSGVTAYTDGVDSLAGGISSLNSSAGGLSQLSDGVASYTQGVSSLSKGAADLEPGIQALVATSTLPDEQKQKILLGYLGLAGGLSQASASGTTLSQKTTSGLDALQSGIGQLASGASKLSAGSAGLSSGTAALADGLGALATGVQQSADGSAQLVTGSTQLQTGLQSGADALAKNTAADPAAAAAVAADPIAVNVSVQHGGGGIASVIAILVIPAGLWIGALAVFLFLRPLSSAVLASSASTARLVSRMFGRASALAVAQVVLVVAYLHLSLGAGWGSLPATFGFSLLVALAFTAFHQLLTTAFGRVGSIISLILFAVQFASTAGVYPAQILSGPFQFISTISPLSYAVSGIQGILTGGAAGPIWSSVVVLALMLLVSLVLAGAALARRRSPVRTGWLLVGARGRRSNPGVHGDIDTDTGTDDSGDAPAAVTHSPRAGLPKPGLAT